ncbi:hypothetical protein ASPZODRAFT_128181 [Penicilliopsis zonata CBS 506.65]|uniref:Uncharacterized protein n=1 Tax=Penicilliopsis zonata CBS 506.65 TaxID=1073090 RepID=A0A1L9SR35_9EURO|nr:hypothetical protein ASPZODRAFT_128181 [Penicilliopsis zonata CBS 506.65]OJJ49680.1 hypothetical protein ASPZODRAFT_128181 [Penicilliopsis zonata CBS 506.65]
MSLAGLRHPASGDESHGHHQHFAVVPPSPTLTNPDMILPFDDGERESSTPSPPFQLPSLSSHLQSLHAPNNSYNHNNTLHHSQSESGVDGTQIGVAISDSGRLQQQQQQQKRGFQRHWMHESIDASRRLSDIGEEDTTSPSHNHNPTTTRYLEPRNQAQGLSGSPTLREQLSMKESREAEGWSSSSSSTISGGSDASSKWVAVKNTGRLEGVAPATSEKQANTHVRKSSVPRNNDGAGAVEQPGAELARTRAVSAPGEGPGEDLSSTILSSEAERILENAKKRLTLMEGNLSRARSSVRLSPSLSPTPSSPSSSSPLGLHQPAGGLYQSISRTDRKSSVLRPRPTHVTTQDAINSLNNRHSRVQSEINLPSASQSSMQSTQATHLSRSVSAMGSTSLSHLRSDERSFRYDPSRAYLTHRASTSSIRPPSAMEGQISYLEEGVTSDLPKGLGILTEPENGSVALSGKSTPSAAASAAANNPPARAQSQLQVRDLQDQMKGLHIKISTLKVKTQEDNLRRRSLQSLRGTSPFTAADQWYTNSMEYRDSMSEFHTHSEQLKREEGSSKPQAEHDKNSFVERSSTSSGSKRTSTPINTARNTPRAPSATGLTHFDDGKSTVESLYEDAEEGDYAYDGSDGSIDREALEKILQEPYEDEDLSDSLEAFPPVPHSLDATPHEEREDAFDYEHFILHSALGSYSRAKLRRSSQSSTGSTETTRPAHTGRHSRADSVASLSTVATFATAMEGDDDDDDLDSVLYWDRKFTAELRSQQRYVEPDAHRKKNDPTSPSETTPRLAWKQAGSRHANGFSSSSGPPTSQSLATSFVSMVRAGSHSKSGTALNQDDAQVLEQLFQSLGNVCMELQAITVAPDHDPKAVRVLRRRLDAARRVLDGELDA